MLGGFIFLYIMNTPLVSIIIPVYRVEKYLSECLDSVLAQDFSDYEIIIVDDGAVDSSGKIADDYAQKDVRIRVIHQANAGVAVARKVGVNHAVAPWIAFVDGDDTLPKTALTDLTSEISDKFNVICGTLDPQIQFPENEITPEKYRQAMVFSLIDDLIEGWSVGLYAKLIRRELCQSVEFPNVKRGEDFMANIRMAFVNDKPVKLISRQVYFYRSNTEFNSNYNLHRTYDYFVKFVREYIASIPQEEFPEYAHLCLPNIFHKLDRVIHDNHKNICIGTPLYVEIMDLVKKYNYKLPLYNRIKYNLPGWVFQLYYWLKTLLST